LFNKEVNPKKVRGPKTPPVRKKVYPPPVGPQTGSKKGKTKGEVPPHRV